MKTAGIFFLASLSCLLASCANPKIGTPVDQYRPFSISGSGYETLLFGSEYLLIYYYHIDKTDKIITFKGTMNCTGNSKNWNYSKGRVTVSFVSKEGKIAEEQTLMSWQNEELCTEKILQSSYPFQDSYDGVTFFFRLEMEE